MWQRSWAGHAFVCCDPIRELAYCDVNLVNSRACSGMIAGLGKAVPHFFAD